MIHSLNHLYHLSGMSCGSCVITVQNKLFDVLGVSRVKVDLGNEQAEIASFEEIKTDTFQKGLRNTDFIQNR